MIIWTGWGILVFVFGLLALVLAQAITNAVFGAGYYENAAWPKVLAGAVAAIGIWVVGSWREARPGRVVVDKATGNEMTLKGRDTFFFIPMRYWAPIVLIASLVLGFTKR